MPDASSVDATWLGRLLVLWREKVALTIFGNLFFWSGYFYLSRHAFVPIHLLPMTWLDDVAGFRGNLWALIYESNFLLVGAVPWLIVSRKELWRYLAGFALLSMSSFIIFLCFPVASPRPPGMTGAGQFLLFIIQVDGPFNAFPSLHASSLVYTLAVARRLFALRSLAWVCLIVWAGLILFGTMATKQHYALDLVAGGLIGLAADWLVWGRFGSSTVMTTRRSNVVTSQAGSK